MEPDSQQDLRDLERVATGDNQAFADLFDRHSAVVLGVLRTMVGRPELAEELLQETFLQAWQQADRYRPTRGTPRGWLIMMARSRAIDTMRSGGARRKREENLGPALHHDGVTSPVGTSEIEADERREAISVALEVLPPEQRQCIELAFFGGMSHREVSEKLEQPLGTVKSRILLGMRRLREALSP
jgi:RNA polymerase sigma-70 factor (ECF subfamily)